MADTARIRTHITTAHGGLGVLPPGVHDLPKGRAELLVGAGMARKARKADGPPLTVARSGPAFVDTRTDDEHDDAGESGDDGGGDAGSDENSDG